MSYDLEQSIFPEFPRTEHLPAFYGYSPNASSDDKIAKKDSLNLILPNGKERQVNMQHITRPFKFICSAPFYLVAYVALLLVMICIRVIDFIYPDRKASMTFVRELMGFNSSHVEIDGVNKEPPARPMGLKVYK